MGRIAFLRRVTAGIALVAMLMAALAPAIGQAIAAARDQHYRWTAVCTAEGARLVPVPTDAAGVPLAPDAHGIDHCPFCSPGSSPPVLPAPEATALPAAAPATVPVPPCFLHAPRSPFAWATTQPRAPPFLP